MTAARGVLLVVVVSVVATAAGYGVARLFYVSDPRPDAPVIDLDNLPSVDAPPPTVASGNGATILPPPTLAPAPPTPPSAVSPGPTSAVSPAPTSPPSPAPTSPPPPQLDEDDDGDDDDGDDDDGDDPDDSDDDDDDDDGDDDAGELDD